MLLFYMLLKAPEETQRTPAMIRPSQQTVMTKAVTDLSPADSLPVCCSLHTKGSCTAMEFNSLLTRILSRNGDSCFLDYFIPVGGQSRDMSSCAFDIDIALVYVGPKNSI